MPTKHATDQRTRVHPVRWDELQSGPTTVRIDRPRTFCRDTLDLRIELGRANISLDEAETLRSGTVVPLDNSASDPVAIYADGQLIARGEVLDVDGKLGVRVVEVIS